MISKVGEHMKKILIKKVGKKGKGVFANQDFLKGQLILKMDRKDVFSDKDFSKFSREDFNHCYNLGKGKYFRMKSPEKYINHSCDPNVFDLQGRVFALKKIKKGEELAYDYSISGVDKWRMRCLCHNKRCRGVVFGEFKKLPLSFQIAYLPYLEKWYKSENRELIKKLNELKRGKHANNNRVQ